MSITCGQTHIQAFVAWAGDTTAAQVIQQMACLKGKYGFPGTMSGRGGPPKPASMFDWGQVWQGQYEGTKIYAAILEPAALTEFLAWSGLNADNMLTITGHTVEPGLSGKKRAVIGWGERTVWVGTPRSSDRAIGVAEEILAAFLRHGWGWTSIVSEGHKMAGTLLHHPYPWGGSMTKLPADQAHIVGRAGDIVYRLLSPSGRVIVKPQLPKGLSGNTAIEKLTGISQPVVAYGTTDAANVFELLQTLKAAAYLGLPAVFDSYDNAHSVESYWERVLRPSLALLSVGLAPQELGLNSAGKFTQAMDAKLVQNAFSQAGLSSTTTQLVSRFAEGTNFATWYRRIMYFLSQHLLSLIEKKVRLVLISTEDWLAHSLFWGHRLTQYARELREQAGHEVVALNRPDGRQLTTDQTVHLPAWSVQEAHQRGWWLSGAGIYGAQYSLGQFGGIIHTVKDSTAGQVHLLAKPYLEDPSSGLYLLPVGLFRLIARGQHEDWSIDPWVMLELLFRWGEDKSRVFMQRVWDAIEIPLERVHIGRKTVVTVDLDGIEIEVRE